MKKGKTSTLGIVLILLSASLACTGQLIWKISSRITSPAMTLMIIIGLVLYGFGALLMIIALRYGELSVLHPMMSVGYVLSLLLGAAVLDEQVTLMRVLGVAVIIAGVLFLNSSNAGEVP